MDITLGELNEDQTKFHYNQLKTVADSWTEKIVYPNDLVTFSQH